MAIKALSIIVDDASKAAHQVAEQFGWTLGGSDFKEFADVHADGVDLWFSTSAAVPSGGIDGLTLHVFVNDVDAAADAVVSRGGTLLLGPVTQDFGMRSAIFQGPGNLMIDLCAPVSDT
ncbi:VOC family protein [Phytoactinopolyspora endophytica]|uniref:VOC family protein n=1 Tax=Phytoactinopolyspora endophytica TaxID=1642495 RepID=UPI00101B92E4|nr:VOC family protein [Phytoactinopolyspora endophytica]